MAVDLVPNPDNFEDIYPSDEEDLDSSDYSEEDGETGEIKEMKDKVADVRKKMEISQEAINRATATMSLLETLMSKMDKPGLKDIESGVDVYVKQREKIYEDRYSAGVEADAKTKELQKLQKELQKLEAKNEKLVDKRTKQKIKVVEKRNRIKRDKRQAKQRLKEERVTFWPQKVYRVVLTLDTPSGETPGSSRRGSIDSAIKPAPPQSPTRDSKSTDDPYGASLCLSYITGAASWLPRYDLSINTPNNSGTIIYRAEFVNTTAETWKDAKVILSTSQTQYGGLTDPIPEMKLWNVHLQRGRYGGGATYSSQELEYSRKRYDAAGGTWDDSKRDVLFGVDGESLPSANIDRKMKKLKESKSNRKAEVEQLAYSASSAFGAASQSLSRSTLSAVTERGERLDSSIGRGGSSRNRMMESQGLARRAPSAKKSRSAIGFGGLFGGGHSGASASLPPPAPSAAPGRPMTQLDQYDPTREDSFREEFAEQGIDDQATLLDQQPNALNFQESSWSETGMTATFPVPGLRTIPPSSTPRRHKIATISLKDIKLAHLSVPKLRPAAFLNSRITNPSSVALLKGSAGITLDGSFLGNTELPRCSPGETFPLPLGVDPSITVLYAPPSMRKNVSSGVFSKEDSTIYTRCITLTNTKNIGQPVDVTVKDQIPISQDERLRVDITVPRGLKSEGDNARAGVLAESETTASVTSTSGSSEATKTGTVRTSTYGLDGTKATQGKDENWGNAKATFKKEGSIEWNVKLNPGKGVKLVLEYEVRWPASESLVGS